MSGLIVSIYPNGKVDNPYDDMLTAIIENHGQQVSLREFGNAIQEQITGDDRAARAMYILSVLMFDYIDVVDFKEV